MEGNLWTWRCKLRKNLTIRDLKSLSENILYENLKKTLSKKIISDFSTQKISIVKMNIWEAFKDEIIAFVISCVRILNNNLSGLIQVWWKQFFNCHVEKFYSLEQFLFMSFDSFSSDLRLKLLKKEKILKFLISYQQHTCRSDFIGILSTCPASYL